MQEEKPDIIILRAKLTPPRLTNTLRRPRLEVLFDRLKETQLIAVTAGAGHGKSTAAAQACRRLGFKTVWYRLDSSDRDLPALASYLVTGLRQHANTFGRVILERIRAASRSKLRSQSLLTLLVNEFEQKIKEHLVIVLDDFHLIQESREICEGMEFLLKNLSEQIHWVVISRTALGIDLARCIVDRRAFSVTEKELAFTPIEIRHLYEQIFDHPLIPQDLEHLSHKTGGWAAGLVLCHYVLSTSEPKSLSLSMGRLHGGHQLFNDYLEKNVFYCLSDDLKNFLMQTAILPSLGVDFCNRLLEGENAGEILRSLERKHLFTFSLDETGHSYHYHHLFKDFLAEKLAKALAPSALKQLYRRAARLWEEAGNLSEAIACYLKADDHAVAGRVLAENGSDLVAGGRVAQVLSFCRQLPQQFLNRRPELQHLVGICLIFKGRNQEALETLQSARKLFEARSDQGGTAMCLVQIAGIHSIQRDVVKAEKIYLQLIATANHLSEPYLFSLSNLIHIYSRMGKILKADLYYRKAETIMDDIGDTHWPALFYAHYCFRLLASDEYDQTIHYANKAVSIAKRFKVHYIAVLAYHLISTALRNQGRYRQAYEAALKGIRISETYGFMDDRYAWNLLNAGAARADQGEFSEGLSYCQKSLSICAQTESDFSEAYCHIIISYIQGLMGNTAEVEAAGRRAFAAIDRTTYEQDKNFIRIALAWGLLGNRQLAESHALMPTVEEIPPHSKRTILWIKLFNVAWNRRAERNEAAKAELVNILQEVKKTGGPEAMKLIAEYQSPILPLLKQIYLESNYQAEISRLVPYLKETPWRGAACFSSKERMEISDAERFLFSLDKEKIVEDLCIRCFGTFEIKRGDLTIASEKWVNLKARTLLKYLALHYPRGYILHEQLLEILWPEQDPAKTRNRLYVALSAIRRMLQPELSRGEASAYLLRQGNAYRLKLGQKGCLDVTEFDCKLRVAENTKDPQIAFTLRLEAEALYRGHLFEDEPYIQWCLEAREIYKDKYTVLLSRIADHYEAEGKTAESIVNLQRALEVDPYAEPLYCRLMELYHRSGNRFMAVKTYERCKRRLELDLQCPLSDDTKQIYRRLVSC